MVSGKNVWVPTVIGPSCWARGDCWVYQFLFAKQDRSNIDLKELLVFRELAKSYARLDAWQIQQMIEIEEFVEIVHD